MSNLINYELDVLAGNPTEIDQIAKRLGQPSLNVTNWASDMFGKPANEIAEGLTELVRFEVVCNLGNIDPSDNSARRFRSYSKDRYRRIVEFHTHSVSEAIPTAVFLLTFRDIQYSYSEKWVMRGGEIVQRMQDYCQKAQAMDWALLDIFAPFIAEYENGLEFGSLWDHWLDDVIKAASDLKAKLQSQIAEGTDRGCDS